QLVAIGIFKEKGVISRAVAFANLRSLGLSSAGPANEFCNPIDFFPRIDPKRDACAIRFVVLVWTQAKEFRRLVAAGGKKSMKISSGFLMNKPKLRQDFFVKLSCHSHVFYP